MIVSFGQAEHPKHCIRELDLPRGDWKVFTNKENFFRYYPFSPYLLHLVSKPQDEMRDFVNVSFTIQWAGLLGCACPLKTLARVLEGYIL